MKSLFLASAGMVLQAAFANANAGSRIFFCTDPQNSNLTQGEYEGLEWLEITGIGSHGETGENTNVLTYDTWDTAVIQKAKGMTDAGSPEIELARIPDDPGQIALRAAAKTNFDYAFKMVRNDPATIGGTGTVLYNRGKVMGPRRPHGRNEDFDLEIFTLALNQLEIAVNPTAGGDAPEFTALPAITGTAEVGEELSLSNGTVTGDATIVYEYAWFAGGVKIAGATANTFELTSAQLGKIITGRVTARNDSGSAFAFSAATASVTNP